MCVLSSWELNCVSTYLRDGGGGGMRCRACSNRQPCVHFVDARCNAVADGDVDEAVHGPKPDCWHGAVQRQRVVAGAASEDDGFAVGVDLSRR